MTFQRTLKKSVSLVGVGLHSGARAEARIKPAAIDQGIIFVRRDLEGKPAIPARYSHVVNTQMATTLGQGRATISTVEHLMAALHGLSIDNAIIEIDGPEIPILDGSALPFFEAIQAVGIDSQDALRPILVLRKRVEVQVGDKWAVAEPSSRLEVHGTVDWDHPAIGYQEFHYIDGATAFSELAGARTFGFLRDFEGLKQKGLARGCSLDNVIALDEYAVLNPDGLRFPNEFARHKVLDALGDFKLAGISLQAHVRMHRAGHDLHNRLICEILRDANQYEILNSRTPSPAAAREDWLSALRPALVGA